MPFITKKRLQDIENKIEMLNIEELKKYISILSSLDSTLELQNNSFNQLIKTLEKKVEDSLQIYFNTAKQLIEKQGAFFEVSLKNNEQIVKDLASKISNETQSLILNQINTFNATSNNLIEKVNEINLKSSNHILDTHNSHSASIEKSIQQNKQELSRTIAKIENEISEKIHTIVHNEINKLTVADIKTKGYEAVLDQFNKELKEMQETEKQSIITAIKALINSKLDVNPSKDRLPVKPIEKDTLYHSNYSKLKTCVVSGIAPMIVGPAGSGKSLACEHIARELGLHFYVANRVQNSFELTGFVNAQGKYVTNQFYEAYTKGGIFLFDEVDASAPEALVTINNAIAQGYMSFPGHAQNIDMHPDFKLVAAGNTYGKGATFLYLGRVIFDAATLDRFMIIDRDYVLSLEKQ